MHVREHQPLKGVCLFKYEKPDVQCLIQDYLFSYNLPEFIHHAVLPMPNHLVTMLEMGQ